MAGFLIVMMWLLMFVGVGSLLIEQLWRLFRYIIEGISIRKIAVRRGLEKNWLAWVPVARHWLFGAVSDQYRQVTAGQQSNRRKTLLILHILTNGLGLLGLSIVVVAMALLQHHDVLGVDYNTIAPVTSVIMLPGIVCLLGYCAAGIACHVYAYFAVFDLYLSSGLENAVRRLVLSIIFPVSLPFFIFSCRNSDDGLPPEIPEE